MSASRVRKLGFDHSFYFWGEEPVALCCLITSHAVKWELEERRGDESEVKAVSLA